MAFSRCSPRVGVTAPSGGLYGGGLSGPNNALMNYGGPPLWISWTLLKQADGTYAFQTTSGYILTANAGGVPGAGFRTDTATDQIGNREKFTLVDNGDFTAHIKTHVGTYLRATGSEIRSVTDVSNATRWRFWVFSPP